MVDRINFKAGGLPNLSFDIDGDSEELYIAVENELGFPEILKMSSDLMSFATSVFAPGDGTSVNVLCGRSNPDIIWASGNFGVNYTVSRYNGEETVYWAPADAGMYWYGEAQPIYLGPDDNHLLVINNDMSKLFTSNFQDPGLYWVELSNYLPFNVRSIDRAQADPYQLIIGAENYWFGAEYSYTMGIQYGDVTYNLAAKGKIITDLVLTT